jgi:capsular exopolysaccharide synthesis family protein
MPVPRQPGNLTLGSHLGPGSPNDDRPTETVRLRDLLAGIRRHFLLVAGLTALSLALSAVVVFREPARYRATAVIQLTDARRSITEGIEVKDADRTNPRDVTASQIQIVKSHALIGAVVDSEGLRLRALRDDLSPALLTGVKIDSGVVTDTLVLTFSAEEASVRHGTRVSQLRYGVPYENGGVTFSLAARPPIPRATLVVSPREATIDRVTDNVRVAARGETSVIDVSYTDVAPEVAQRVTNRLVQMFQSNNIRSAQRQASRRGAFLKEQLSEIDAQLAMAENALSAFRSRGQVYSSRGKLEAQQGALMTLDMHREELDADRRMYRELLGRLQQPRSATGEDEIRALVAVPGLSANPVVSQLYQQRVQYQTARDSLTTGEWRSASGNPDVARLDQLIASTDQRFVGALNGQIATLDARLTALDTLRARTAAIAATLPGMESTEEQLVRRVEANRNLADRLKDEYQKARMAEEVEAGQVEIVDMAPLPYQPLSRMRSFKLALGLLVGLGLGGVATVVAETASTRVRRRDDLEGELRVPVLSVIPRIEAQRNKRNSLSLRTTIARRENGRAGRGDRASPHEHATGIPMTPAGSEAFRLLRSSLKWGQVGNTTRTLAVTSANPREGKTTTSTNLAAVFALEGKQVLLIDCDVRRTRLHRAFRVPRNPGLVQVLRGMLPPATAVRTTFISGLSFLPAGHDTDNFPDLLGSERMRTLLAELSGDFDVIVLDTPPVLAVADAIAIAPLVDGVVLVVQSGVTDRRAVQQSLQQLERVGAQLVGAVLNDSQGETQRYGEYYYSEEYTMVGE